MNTAEKYMLLNLNRQGDFSVLNQSLLTIGLLASGLRDLAADEIIRMNPSEKLEIMSQLPERLQSLEGLWLFVQAKRPSLELLMTDYVIRLNNRSESLFHSLGTSLIRQDMATTSMRDSMIKKFLFLPNGEKFELLKWEIQWELEREDIAPEVADLWHILRLTEQHLPVTNRESRSKLMSLPETVYSEWCRQMVTAYTALKAGRK